MKSDITWECHTIVPQAIVEEKTTENFMVENVSATWITIFQHMDGRIVTIMTRRPILADETV